MGLIDHIWRLFRPDPPPPTTAVAPPPRPTAEMRLLAVESDRRSVVQICRQMYDQDPRAEGVLRGLARDITRGGFQVTVQRGAGAGRARQVAQDLIDRLNLASRCDDWSRLTWRDGDTFLEVEVDAQGLIQGVTRKPTLEMHRASDEFDRFPDPERAYWWADELYSTVTIPPASARWFAAWQIIHIRWGHDEGSRYGRPLFASARGAWKKLTEGETDIAVRRKTRAGMTRVHVLKNATEDEILAYQDRNAALLGAEGARSAMSDFFTNVEGGVSTLDGDAHLSEIDDVEHHLTTFGIASPMPLYLLGYGENLNRDVLEQQQEQYEVTQESICQWLDDQVVYPLIELQWLLQGILPASLTYAVTRPPRVQVTPELLQAVADTVTKLRAANLPEEMVWELAAKLLPGLDTERITQLLAAAEAAKAQAAAAAPPSQGNNPPPAMQQGGDSNAAT